MYTLLLTWQEESVGLLTEERKTLTLLAPTHMLLGDSQDISVTVPKTRKSTPPVTVNVASTDILEAKIGYKTHHGCLLSLSGKSVGNTEVTVSAGESSQSFTVTVVPSGPSTHSVIFSSNCNSNGSTCCLSSKCL